jgi:hypothetical protein
MLSPTGGLRAGPAPLTLDPFGGYLTCGMIASIDSRVGPLTLDTVIEGYLRYSASLQQGADAAALGDSVEEAAYDALETAIWRAPPATVWELVTELLRRAPDHDLETHAVGPLENLVSRRGPELIDQIEAEANSDPRFRWALGCIWLSRGKLPDEVLARVVRASGDEIKPLPPLQELEEEWPITAAEPGVAADAGPE